MQPPASNNSNKCSKPARSHFIKVVATPLWGVYSGRANPFQTAHSAVATAPHVCGTASMRKIWVAIMAIVVCSVIAIQAQEPVPEPAPTPQRLTATPRPDVTIEEVIVTGSNIPTAEEVGPQPVYV